MNSIRPTWLGRLRAPGIIFFLVSSFFMFGVIRWGSVKGMLSYFRGASLIAEGRKSIDEADPEFREWLVTIRNLSERTLTVVRIISDCDCVVVSPPTFEVKALSKIELVVRARRGEDTARHRLLCVDSNNVDHNVWLDLETKA